MSAESAAVAPDQQHEALISGVGAVDAVDAGLVRVVGTDATTFLQSLVSVDLDPLGDGDGAHSLLLTPRGKLDVDFRALRVSGTEWTLAVAEGRDAERLAASLSRFKIRVDVTIEPVEAPQMIVRVYGCHALSLVERSLAVPPPGTQHAHGAIGEVTMVRADLGDVPGVDLVGPSPAVAGLRDALIVAGATPVGQEAFEALRIECGQPRGGTDTDETTIPQEAFLERDAISFDKGCFLGQEVVARIDSRGRVTRLQRTLVATSEIGAGDEIVTADGVVGDVTSTAWSPRHGVVALARVRRDVEPPAEVIVRHAGGDVEATVRESPLRRGA